MPDINNLTQSQQIKLQLLQLVYRHDRSPEDVIFKAEKLEEFVNGKSAAKAVSDRKAKTD